MVGSEGGWRQQPMSPWAPGKVCRGCSRRARLGRRGTSSQMTFPDTLPPANDKKGSFRFLPSHSSANALTRADLSGLTSLLLPLLIHR